MSLLSFSSLRGIFYIFISTKLLTRVTLERSIMYYSRKTSVVTSQIFALFIGTYLIIQYRNIQGLGEAMNLLQMVVQYYKDA